MAKLPFHLGSKKSSYFLGTSPGATRRVLKSDGRHVVVVGRPISLAIFVRVEIGSSLWRGIASQDARLHQSRHMLVAWAHDVGFKLSTPKLRQYPIRDSFTRGTVGVEFHGIALFKIDFDFFQMIGAQVAV